MRKYSPELSPAPSEEPAAAGPVSSSSTSSIAGASTVRLSSSNASTGKNALSQLSGMAKTAGTPLLAGPDSPENSKGNYSSNGYAGRKIFSIGTTQQQQSPEHVHASNNDNRDVAQPATVGPHAAQQESSSASPSAPPSFSTVDAKLYKKGDVGGNSAASTRAGRQSAILRVPFPARAPPPPRSVAQLEQAMMDLKLYDSCLFWGKSGAVNLKPEGNSWDDDMVIQSKDPAWVRNSVQPPIPADQELLILPPIAKIERSIEVFYGHSHLYPPFITPLIVERAKQTRSNQVSRILLNTIAGIAIRIDPDIENMLTMTMSIGGSGTGTGTRAGTWTVQKDSHTTAAAAAAADSNKTQYMRYFNRAYGLLQHLEDIRSTYSTTYLQAALLLCYVYPKPQLRVELLKLMTEAAFLGLHVDASRWMPRPVVIRNRCWLFWACYMFDSVHHVIRGQLTQMDDHYLDAPLPPLTELDHDDGLWTSWFMLKEIHLWRIGRKIHAFFQAGLKRMDRLIEESARSGKETEQEQNRQRKERTKVLGSGRDAAPAFFMDMQEVLTSECSEAELVVSLQFWTDGLPAALTAQLDHGFFERTDPRVNGRAVGLQLVYAILRVLLLYPSMLAIGTNLLAKSVSTFPAFVPSSASSVSSLSPASTLLPSGPSPAAVEAGATTTTTAQQYQHQHLLRRQELLEKIMKCVQEADRIVGLTTVVLEKYPERARMSCVGVALDWCLRIYYKIVTEKPVTRVGNSQASSNYSNIGSGGTVGNQQQQQQHGQTTTPGIMEAEMDRWVFSARLKARCRAQVTKVAKLLRQFEGLDHKHFFSWLTIELESLEEHQRTEQQRMIQKCLEGVANDFGATAASMATATALRAGASDGLDMAMPIAISMPGTVNLAGTGQEYLFAQQQQQQQQQRPQSHSQQQLYQHQQLQQHQQQEMHPKSHDLQTIIRKRQQMGIYANSGIRPNGGHGNYLGLTPSPPNLSTTSASPISVSVSSAASVPLPSSPSSSSSVSVPSPETTNGSEMMFLDGGGQMKVSAAYSTTMVESHSSAAAAGISPLSTVSGSGTFGHGQLSVTPHHHHQRYQEQQQQAVYHLGYHHQQSTNVGGEARHYNAHQQQQQQQQQRQQQPPQHIQQHSNSVSLESFF
ncbi:hypothetical protein BGZ54_008653 [Gamsiella multidivaricata]|nr:hypothetical protein BGZ54_008653 [Gamsiella multidivaricata]